MRHITINTIPDDALLEVFDWFRLLEERLGGRYRWTWYTLAHVCYQWRRLVFASPERLGLRYHITHRSPITRRSPIADILRHPHQLPLVLDYQSGVGDDPWCLEAIEDLALALEQLDRVQEISLRVGSSGQLYDMFEMMARPARRLEHLSIQAVCRKTWFPVTLFGDHTPALRTLSFENILVPLPSSPWLADLSIILNIGDMNALVLDKLFESVRAMSQLEYICLVFFPEDTRMVNEDRVVPFSGTPASLASLSEIHFHGSSLLFEALASRIDAPNLCMLELSFFRNGRHVPAPSLSRFIRSISILPLSTNSRLRLDRSMADIRTVTDPVHGFSIGYGLECRDLGHHTDPLVVSVSAVCRSLAPVLSLVIKLNIENSGIASPVPQDRTYWADNAVDWHTILAAFSGVVTLQLDDTLLLAVAQALRESDGHVLLPNFREFELFTRDGKGLRVPKRIREEFQSLFPPRDPPISA
ncbi:hypothetical protein BC834DRAFT_282139 [Gloeopeniophorella convolvens]|nr:hypothetical protein BC834DRAFT_282139 [Gloeopeniophorella convolvens]